MSRRSRPSDVPAALLSGVRQNNRVSVPGRLPAAGVSPVVSTKGLAPGLFAAMRLPIVLGRAFTDADDGRALPVAIVSEGFVRDFFGGQNPIGQEIVGCAAADRATIVGVAADAKYTVLRGGMPPVVYFPAFQHLDGNANFALRLVSPRQAGARCCTALRRSIQSPTAVPHSCSQPPRSSHPGFLRDV